MRRPDRRRSFRYKPTRDAAALGWWEGKHFRTVQVQLRNISTGGALISLGEARPASPKVWLSLVGQDVSQWARAEVVEQTEDEAGTALLRLAFPETCPYVVFKLAVCGQRKCDEIDSTAGFPPSSSAQDDDATMAETLAGRSWTGDLVLPPEAGFDPKSVGDLLPEVTRQALALELVPKERDRRLPSFHWIVVLVVNLILAFWLGALAAHEFRSIRTIWTHLGL